MRRLTGSRVVLAVAVVGLAVGCMDGDPALSVRVGAVGEPTNGFPSALERLGLMAINRARSDPQTVKGNASASYPARPPVIWSLALNQSARFHAMNLRLGDVTLMHDSPCPLKTDIATSGCNGDPACACASPVGSACAMCGKVAATSNGCGTALVTRIGYFLAGTNISLSGEVAAAGYADPIATVNGWMDEASGNDGHRRNLTDQGVTSNTMGYGHANGTPACLSTFDISDSGNIKNATIPKIPTAAVAPASGNAGTFTFYATWADPAHGAPGSLNVVVDGACRPMARELGTDTLNATYKATASLTAGCHDYWVSATDATGAAVTYPTTGALTISVGGTACSADYVATAVGACGTDAGTAPGTGGTGGSGGAATGTGGAGGRVSGTGGRATGGATGTGGRGAAGNAGSGTGGGGGTTAVDGTGGGAGTPAQTGGTGGAASTAGSDSGGGCSCQIAGRPDSALPVLLLAGLGLVGRRRTRAARHARSGGLCQAGGTGNSDVERS